MELHLPLPPECHHRLTVVSVLIDTYSASILKPVQIFRANYSDSKKAKSNTVVARNGLSTPPSRCLLSDCGNPTGIMKQHMGAEGKAEDIPNAVVLFSVKTVSLFMTLGNLLKPRCRESSEVHISPLLQFLWAPVSSVSSSCLWLSKAPRCPSHSLA